MADLRIRVLVTSKDAGFAKVFRGGADDVRGLTKELRSLERVMTKLGKAAPIASPFQTAASAIRDTTEETRKLNEQLKEAAKTGRRIRVTPDTAAGGPGQPGDGAAPRRTRRPRAGSAAAGAGDDPNQPQVIRRRRRYIYEREDRPGEEQDRWGARVHHTGLALERGARRTAGVLMGVLGPYEEYERAMVATIAVTDDAANNLANESILRKASMGFSDLGYTATDTTKALEFMALAGFKTQEQLAAIPHVLDAARAGGEDLEKSASLLTDTMTAFGKKAADMSQVADVMTYVNNKTNTTLSLTARAMFEIGPYAVDAGLSMESMAAAVGVLAEAGIKGAKAGTAVRNMLLFLSKPAKPAREEIKALGLSFKELNGYIAKNDLSGAIVRIDDAMKAKGYDAADRRRVYGTVFGSYTAGKASIIAQAARSGRFQEFEQGALASKGATHAAAMRKLKSDPGRMDVMRAKWEEVQLTLATKILPELLPVAEGLLELGQGFAEFAKENPGFVRALSKQLVLMTILGATAGPAMTTLGAMTRFAATLQSVGAAGSMSSAASAVGRASTAASGAAESFGTAATSAKGATGVIGKFGVVLGKGGLVTSALLAGVAIGTLIDQLTGFSDWYADTHGNKGKTLTETAGKGFKGKSLGEMAEEDRTALLKSQHKVKKLKQYKDDLGQDRIFKGIGINKRRALQEEADRMIAAEEANQASIYAKAARNADVRESVKKLAAEKVAPQVQQIEQLRAREAELQERLGVRSEVTMSGVGGRSGFSILSGEAVGRSSGGKRDARREAALQELRVVQERIVATEKVANEAAIRAGEKNYKKLIEIKFDATTSKATMAVDGREISDGEALSLPDT